MSNVIKRASQSDRRRSGTSSEDSDTLQAALDAEERMKEDKRVLKERRAEGAAKNKKA
jgi:hypothetical protein